MGADVCDVGMWRSITGDQLGRSVTEYDRHYSHQEVNHLDQHSFYWMAISNVTTDHPEDRPHHTDTRNYQLSSLS